MANRKTQEQICEEIKNAGQDEYIVLGEYVNMSTKLRIKHKICQAEWDCNLRHFLYDGSRCPKCAQEKQRQAVTQSQEQFEKEVKEKFNSNIEVLGIYTQTHTPIDFLCHKCGSVWTTQPNAILKAKYGCPVCAAKNGKTPPTKSKGRLFIEGILDGGNVPYKNEVSFPDLKVVSKLRFDFGIYNGEELVKLIEFDGIQHTKPSGMMNNKSIKEYDFIKNRYCIENKIPLLRIPYNLIDVIDLEYLLTQESFANQIQTDLIALDQATTSGVSIWFKNTLIDFFSETMPSKGDENLPYFERFIESLILEYYPKQIVFESILDLEEKPTPKSKHTFEILAFYQGIIRNTCLKYKVPYEEIVASAWKKTLGVKGKYRSEQKISCKKIINQYFKIDSEDICDAIGIGYHYLNKNSGETKERSAF